MILIGQYDSPFVRRVGVALHCYGFTWTHQPWSSFGDGARIATHNPLRRVPTLILDDGAVLIESFAILDHLDESVGSARAMLPGRGIARREALQACALAVGLADKAVALVFERVLHEVPSAVWVARCEAQIDGTLTRLEALRTEATGPFLFGEAIGHADIALACALRFLRDAHPGLWDAAPRPALARHADRCEALPAFEAVQQAFISPA